MVRILWNLIRMGSAGNQRMHQIRLFLQPLAHLTVIFHSCMQTELEAMPAILLAAFSSFGIAMTSNALILEYVHWKHCRAGRIQSADLTMDVETSYRRESNGDIESGPANTRSPNYRRQAASEGHFSHES